MNYGKLLLFGILLLFILTVNADEQMFITCGGDDQLQLLCLGDNQNTFGGISEVSGIISGGGGLTVQINDSKVFTENVVITPECRIYPIENLEYCFPNIWPGYILGGIFISLLLIIIILILVIRYFILWKRKNEKDNPSN